MQTAVPPGQSFAKRWAIYAAFGAPTLDLKTWRLSTKGLVEKPLTLSFGELEKLPQVNLTRDFHCVTTWSIKDVVWEGVSFRELANLTSVKKEAQWVMFHSLTGIPLQYHWKMQWWRILS
jgi:DMSO/TMAO reductase YedYZ molybdopterin-dependent catalytic subunit